MGRAAASIQTRITALETQINAYAANSIASDGTSISYPDLAKLEQRLDILYVQLDRANGSAPMLSRGRLTGLGTRSG